MKQIGINIFKGFMFFAIFLGLFYLFTYLTIPKYNVGDFLLSDIANYSILSEEKDTVDVIALGDSLIYSSLSPMEIYGEYGYTVFDCSDAAQLLTTTIKNLELSLESQHPKIVMVEASVFYRDERKAEFGKKFVNKLRRYTSLIQTHNNWKKLLSRKSNKTKWINVEKGYKYNDKVKAVKKIKNFEYSEGMLEFPYINLDYFNQIVNMCKDNDIKLILVGFPSLHSWNYEKHNYVKKLAEENDLEYFNLNFDDPLDIDWKMDTKDGGTHLNFNGAKKVSSYIGKYLHDTNLLTDHRKDKKYKAWNIAYNSHLKTLSENNSPSY